MTGVSSIYHHGPSPEPTGDVEDQRNRDAAKHHWHQRGYLLIKPEWVGNWEDRQYLIGIGIGLFGKRKGSGE